MNKQYFSKLTREAMVEEYSKLYDKYLLMLAENEILKVKKQQSEEMNQLLINKIRILKK